MSITVMKQALEALENLQGLCSEEGNFIEQLTIWTPEAMYALRTAIEQAEKQEPVAWTEREKELIDGMIEVQLDHARRCDNIANRTMAEKQKGWDMERVTLLQKIKATPTAAQRQPLTDDEIWKFWWSRPAVDDGDMESQFVAAVRAVLAMQGITGEKA